MKIITKMIKPLLIAATITLFSPIINLPVEANPLLKKVTNFSLVRDKRGNITGINNLTIDNQRYNIKFIYGTFGEIFNRDNPPTFWQNPQAATKANDVLNSVLTSRQVIATKLGIIPQKYQAVKFMGSGSSYLIPVKSEKLVRQYGKERSENSYITGAISSFSTTQKAWNSYLFNEFSITPNTPFLYVQFKKQI